MIPNKNQNPKGLHKRYIIRKVTGVKTDGTLITKAVDKNAEYFIMRLDKNGKDPIHIEACRKAVLHYAKLIKNHLPELSKDLIKRYTI